MEKERSAYLSTAIGTIRITGLPTGITSVGFIEEEEKFSKEELGEPYYPVMRCLGQLKEYFIGQREDFDLDLILEGTGFQMKVWKELMKIPYGRTTSYGKIAERVGSPGAARAVGGANNKNPIGIIVPCHRVIGADGALVGYAKGIDKKRWLLEMEGALVAL